MDNIAINFNIIKLLFFYLTIINLIAYAMMWHDKRCAQKGQWRIKERTLLTISLIGGSIGSLIGMYKFRHKTKHFSFKYGIPFIIIFQIFLVIIFKYKLFVYIYKI